MPRKYFPDIVGNDNLITRLSKDISDNSLSHAYIIEGPMGSGRHSIALRTAAAVSCLRKDGDSLPCGKCKNCEKILGAKCPDIVSVGLEDDKVTIGVEAIRQLKNDMYTAPNDLSVKVYIIEDADRMTVQAQNAFLLSLEEPPEYIIFFLICENSVNLLETVRSRAPTLRTQRLTSSEIEEYLISKEKRASELKSESPAEFNELVFVASGCIGYALDLLDTKTRKQVFEHRRFAKELISMLATPSKANGLEAIKAFGTKRPEIIVRLSCLQYALRDLILLKKSDTAPLCFFEDREQASELSTHYRGAALLSLYDASETAIDDMERNANVRLTLVNMMQAAKLL